MAENGKLPTNCLSMLDQLLGLALKGLVASFSFKTDNLLKGEH